MTDLTVPQQIENATPIQLVGEQITETDSYNNVREDLKALYDELWTLSVQCIFISPAQRTTFILWVFLLRMTSFLRYAPILVIDANKRGCGKSTLQKFISTMAALTETERFSDFTKAGLKKLDADSHLFLDEVDRLPAQSLRSIEELLNTRFESDGSQSVNAYGSSSSFGFSCLPYIVSLSYQQNSSFQSLE